ncbi:hypothetical protein CBS147346_10545 [Aspergillus niger]|nr:hypothetical protein CBS147346_10545 [Aspergillus niger]
MTASIEILQSDYDLKFQPVDSSLHERLSDFLKTRANLVEEKKWMIHLGTHTIIVRDQLTKAFQNILAVKDIVTTAANASLPASLACAGIMACFTTVIQAAEQHSHLLQGLESISELICRLHVMERLYLHSDTKQDIGLLDDLRKTMISFYSKILEFQARALCYLHRPRAYQFWRDVLNRDGWANLLQEFERYQITLGRTTSVIADAGSMQRYEELQDKYQRILEALHNRNIWAATSDRDEKVKRFLNLLYTCPYKDRKDRNSKRVLGTCEWFIGHEKFHAWQGSAGNGLSSLLWVSADPGCGKSVLTRYLVDEVLVSNDKRTVCYFFFKDDFTDQKSATSALSVILRQLFIAQPHLLHDAILDKADTDSSKLTQSFSELWSILMSVSTDPKAAEIYCLLDALDECHDEDRSRLINAVNDFYANTHKNSKLKFLITSRPYEHIRRGFSPLITESPTIHLSGDDGEEAEQISHEINLVIRKRVQDISKQRSLMKEECTMLIDRLTAVQNRTYLWTPLSWAAERGHVAVVKLLLAAEEVDIDSRNSIGRSPLSLAAQNGHDEVVKLLIREDVDIDSKDVPGSTPLALAAENGHERIVRLLLATGKAVIDSRDSSGNSPLSLAAQFGHEAVVKIVLATGEVDVNNKDSRGKTPISWAAREGYEAVVRRLLDTGKVEVDCKDSDNGTPLLLAAIEGCEGIVKRLLATGQVDVNIRDRRYGREPLSWAAGEGHEAVVKLLLSTREVDVDVRDPRYGRSPLSWAAGEGHEEVVELLLATGKVDVESKSIRGRTPLSWAAWEGHDTVVKLLLATGEVDVNSRDSEGRTPLSWAAENGNEAVIKLLIATGNADVSARDVNGRTPQDWAAEYDHQSVVKIFRMC